MRLQTAPTSSIILLTGTKFVRFIQQPGALPRTTPLPPGVCSGPLCFRTGLAPGLAACTEHVARTEPAEVTRTEPAACTELVARTEPAEVTRTEPAACTEFVARTEPVEVTRTEPAACTELVARTEPVEVK